MLESANAEIEWSGDILLVPDFDTPVYSDITAQDWSHFSTSCYISLSQVDNNSYFTYPLQELVKECYNNLQSAMQTRVLACNVGASLLKMIQKSDDNWGFDFVPRLFYGGSYESQKST